RKFLGITGIEKAIPAFDIFREIRKIKNEDEIAVMREGIEITELGIKAALEAAHAGSSGFELVRAFSETVAGQGMTNFLPSISLGKGSYLQHNYFPSNNKLQRGDLIRFDVACQYKYHFTDIGRNAVLGKASDRQKECYKVVYAGEDSAIASLRPGMKASEVFKAGVEGARKAGMPNFQRNHCGHGIGLEMYELPFITPASNDVIEKNCVLNIETPYYEISNGGYMVEDTILVTERGAEFLTKLDRGLIEIPV
ncbi:MAG: Xaa-Pro peptidase family protein, partial [Thaumarchaeota archaeon]|nr:Xaa-Pro peptidase family protein [Nitrososphaerota archaeon]